MGKRSLRILWLDWAGMGADGSVGSGPRGHRRRDLPVGVFRIYTDMPDGMRLSQGQSSKPAGIKAYCRSPHITISNATYSRPKGLTHCEVVVNA